MNRKENNKKRFITILIISLLLVVMAAVHANATTLAPDGDAVETMPVDETVVTEPSHEHTYVETIVEPNCIYGGYTTYECECGHVYEDNFVDALGHTYNHTTVEPTYTTRGYDKHECTVCGHCFINNWTEKVAHDCDYDSVVTYATCTSDGYTTKTCKLCGDVQICDHVKSLAHKYINETIKPTCTKKGYDLHTCVLCNTSYQDNEVNMIPHKYASKVTAPTCTSKGYTTYTCSCGKTYKDNETDKIAHQYNDVVNAPTCTTDGNTTHTCKVCGYSYTDSYVEKIPHSYSDYKSDNNATCEHDGTETSTCAGCKDAKTRAAAGSAKGHKLTGWEPFDATHHSRYCTRKECPYIETVACKFDIENVVAPTCTEEGYTEQKCVCGKVGGKKDIVEKLGHEYGEIKTVAPTYTEKGYDVKVCKVCNYENKSNYVDVVPHDCTYKDVVTKPTCTENGYTTHTCKICGDTKIDTNVEPLGHDYKQKVVSPKCEEAGYTKNTCSRCKDEYKSDEVTATGHNYKTSTVEATTGWGGYDYHKCKTCGHSYKDNEVAKLPASGWPKGYQDGTCRIVIYKEWYKNAYVYAAHVTFSDYDRLWVECANGKYNSGGETTSGAARRVGAILAINGDFAVPGNGAGGYAIARKGVVCNDKKAYPEGVYNSNTGLLTFGHSGRMLSELVAEGLVTDTFQFGPVCLKDGQVIGDPNSNSRAQRTFIGTNGAPGDIWLCVSDGRYNDGKSAGLNGYECGAYLKSKGCTLCVPLDGGGSSTIYFNGQVLNAASGGQRAVVDFLVFK